MKTIKILAAFFLAFTMSNCEEHDPTVDGADVPLSIGFAKAVDTYSIDPANPVYRLGVTTTQPSNVDRVVNVVLNETASDFLPGDFTFNNTVVIPAGSYIGYGDITFDFDNVPAGTARNLTFDIVIPEGTVLNTAKDQIVLNYKPLCSLNELTLNITFDNYSEEISWELYDEAGNIVTSSNGVYPEAQTTANAVFCVEDGNYIFVINDSYGDGLGTTGSYTITDANGVNIVSGDGAFTSYRLHEFSVGN